MLTETQAQKLTAAPSRDILAALNGSPIDASSETAAALGVGYELGTLQIPPITLGILPLLEAIESPLIDDGAGDSFSPSDIIRTVYVICEGFDAAKSIMAMSRRKAALHNERERASQSPELYRVYLEKVDALEQKWIEFDTAAAEYWERHVGTSAGLVDAAEVISRALKDALAGLAAIPKGEKKKAGGWTLNGWRP
jgi:hypothetical protein